MHYQQFTFNPLTYQFDSHTSSLSPSPSLYIYSFGNLQYSFSGKVLSSYQYQIGKIQTKLRFSERTQKKKKMKRAKQPLALAFLPLAISLLICFAGCVGVYSFKFPSIIKMSLFTRSLNRSVDIVAAFSRLYSINPHLLFGIFSYCIFVL